MFKVGITERGDAGLDLSWVDKLLDLNILITKSVNDKFIEKLMESHNSGYKIILHATCTGLGGKKIEPNVPAPEWTHSQVVDLIEAGFPAEQIVLRIDPIIPTERGIETAQNVLELFRDIEILRVRYSFLDMYPHVKERLRQAGLPVRYESFHAPREMINNALNMLDFYSDIFEFESCAEDTPHQLGCVSHKDLNIFGITADLSGTSNQRKGCLCVANKTELLTQKKQCKHGCLYCYWRG